MALETVERHEWKLVSVSQTARVGDETSRQQERRRKRTGERERNRRLTLSYA